MYACIAASVVFIFAIIIATLALANLAPTASIIKYLVEEISGKPQTSRQEAKTSAHATPISKQASAHYGYQQMMDFSTFSKVCFSTNINNFASRALNCTSSLARAIAGDFCNVRLITCWLH
jgi:hypothetical protein